MDIPIRIRGALGLSKLRLQGGLSPVACEMNALMGANAESSGQAAVQARHSVFKRIRVRKEDSAYVYFILESHEGIVSYSTLPFQKGDPHRDLELRIPPDFVNDVNDLLKQFGEMVYELS